MSDDRDERLVQRAAEVLRAPGAGDVAALADVVAAIRREASRRDTEAVRVTGVRRRFRRVRRQPLVPRGAARFIAGLAAGVVFAAGLGVGIWTGWRMRGASYGLAADAVRMREPVATTASGASLGSALEPVRFVLVAPAATRVSLVGEFNDWDPSATPMARADGGAWHVALPLPRGRHVYAFVVDGSSWVADPAAPLAPERWFGATNSVVLVRGGRTQ